MIDDVYTYWYSQSNGTFFVLSDPVLYFQVQTVVKNFAIKPCTSERMSRQIVLDSCALSPRRRNEGALVVYAWHNRNFPCIKLLILFKDKKWTPLVYLLPNNADYNQVLFLMFLASHHDQTMPWSCWCQDQINIASAPRHLAML